MKLYAWRCPTCREDVPGQYTPRWDNPCRICTGCSLRGGEIVKRFRDGPYGAAAKMAPPSTAWKGVDLQEELKRLTDLDCVRDAFGRFKPRLHLRHKPTMPKTALGWALFLRHEIRIILWPALSVGGALSTLAHEVAHLAVGKIGHGRRWRSTYVEIVRDGYGVRQLMIPACLRGTTAGLDIAVENALDQWKEGGDGDR